MYRPLHLRLAGYRGARDESVFAPLARYLTDRGTTIQTNIKLRQIDVDPDTGTLRGLIFDDGQRVTGGAYMIAIPAWALARLLPPPLRDQRFFAGIAELPVAPAISVQLWFDRPVTGGPDFYIVARTAAPVFQEQSPHTYPVSQGARISVIVSPADDLLSEGDQSLVQTVVRSLGAVNAEIAAAPVTKSVVLKHPQHLIRYRASPPASPHS